MAAPTTEIALIKQAMDFQNKEIAEIKKILLEFIDSADNKFATKEEHKANEKAIEEIRASHVKIAWSAISFVCASII